MNLAASISSSDCGQPQAHLADAGMVYVPGGTFCMGSDKHYPEERPVHSGVGTDPHSLSGAVSKIVIRMEEGASRVGPSKPPSSELLREADPLIIGGADVWLGQPLRLGRAVPILDLGPVAAWPSYSVILSHRIRSQPRRCRKGESA